MAFWQMSLNCILLIKFFFSNKHIHVIFTKRLKNIKKKSYKLVKILVKKLFKVYKKKKEYVKN